MDTSKLNLITQMIDIRDYMRSAVDNPTLDRKVIADYNMMTILMDRRIQEELMSEEFKSFIKYEEREQVLREVAIITNIKSGMKK